MPSALEPATDASRVSRAIEPREEYISRRRISRIYVTKVKPKFRRLALHNFGHAEADRTWALISGSSRWIDISIKRIVPSQMAAWLLSFALLTPIDDGAVQHGRPFVDHETEFFRLLPRVMNSCRPLES